jgi:uncharacterized membrane protein HdeD (DUF308 family)
MRRVMIGLGILMVLVGVVWLLQGVGILLGSVMTGQSFWAVMGVLMIVVGAALSFFGMRRKPSGAQP